MTPKKKILFFHFDLQGGGAEKVLVNLLNKLNPEKYDITLQTIFGVGPNLKNIPKSVKFKCLFKKQFKGFNTIMKLFSPRMLHKFLVHDRYDVEVGYMENSPTRIVSGCCNNNTKTVGWVHIEIENKKNFLVGYRNKNEAIQCYNNLDNIVFVAKTALKSFESFFPEITTKKKVIYNVNDYDQIRKLSRESIPIRLNSDIINICSVGRLASQKRFDRLINVIAKLKNDGFNLHLYILGEGNDRLKLENQIKQLSLENEVTLLGFDVNPYKYVAKMDLFVCSSQKEGYSTAVTEAVSLGIPVVTTKCSGMEEILHNGEYGLIVDNNENSLYEGLKNILDNPDKMNYYRKNIVNSNSFDTIFLVEKYEEFFDSI